MDELDFDFGEFLGDIESGLDLSGGDTSWLDTVDWGSMLDNMDFSNLDLSNVFGYVGEGGLGAPEDVVIVGERPTDLAGFDLETADQVYAGSDLGTGLSYYPGEGYGTGEAGGMGGAEGLIGDTDDFFGMGDGAGTIVITGKKENEPSILTDEEHVRTDVDVDKPCPPGSETVQKFRDGSTMTLDCKGNVIGSTPKTTDIDQGDVDDPDPTPGCPPGSNKTTKLANGWTIVTDCKGNVVSSTGPGGTTTTAPPTTDNKKLLEQLLALLGGIMGLTMNKPKPVGYQGGIPSYMATRGAPGQGISFTPRAAYNGGLMSLAAGGSARPARYLRGGTDGMADKIQTDIDGKQPARLSHGEFVIPADVVSHLGNGNSDAGADVLYDMMAKVRKARTGTPKQGRQINPRKFTPV